MGTQGWDLSAEAGETGGGCGGVGAQGLGPRAVLSEGLLTNSE